LGAAALSQIGEVSQLRAGPSSNESALRNKRLAPTGPPVKAAGIVDLGQADIP